MANSIETTLMTALSSLPAADIHRLALSISAAHRRRLLRLAAVLSSPSLFSLSLRHLHTLSLRRKSLLVAHHLLSDLDLLRSHLPSPPAAAATQSSSSAASLRDLDATLLLLLLCELHRHDRRLLDSPPQNWRPTLRDYASDWILRPSSLAGGCSDSEALIRFVESARRCWSLVGVGGKGGGGTAAASPAAVVSLPSVAAEGGGECAICREEMGAGREVCELPCGHLFHWICVLRWLGRRDTCPCCRRRLPSDDVRREIERLMDDIAGVGGGGGGGGL